ncbi:Sensory/regulatory protein RpfC [bioreactor metagenome]|uniref:histidine kinase n=1 Tax=bioreactor metagenome TaxID=1076179 RepID=A0A645A2I5_9ZZZZ
MITSLIALALSIFIVILTITYSRNQRLKRKLEKNTAELIEAKEMAEESNRLKSAFLANMSHEIRTPLNAIVGFSNLLAEPDFPEEEKIQVSSIIANNSELLLTLITDILDISGLETGKLHFVFKDINVGEICTQVLNTSGHLKKPGVEYKFVNTEPDMVIRSDAHRLSQVLLNLVTNAAKFTEKGEIALEYKQIECEGKQELMFSVTDTGCGISAEQHYKLFERFGKLDDFKQGAGLGLAISKQIIIKLGGRIWIDPNYTNGARFCFTHPV